MTSCRARTAVTAPMRLPVPVTTSVGPARWTRSDLREVGEQGVLDRRRWPEAEPLLRVDHRDDAGRRVERDHPAVADDGDAIGEPLRLLHQVRHEDDGDAAAADRLDEVPRVAARLRVESGRQLVEDRDPWLTDEREGDRQALLLAAGEVAVRRVALLAETQLIDQRAWIGRIVVERREQLEGLADGHPVGQLALLELDADEAAQALAVPAGIEAQDPDRAGVGRPQTGDRLDGGRLAGAVRSEDAEDLALLDGEGHAVDRRAVAISLGEVGDFDDVHGPSIAHGSGERHRRGGRISRRDRSMAGSTERLMRVRSSGIPEAGRGRSAATRSRAAHLGSASSDAVGAEADRGRRPVVDGPTGRVPWAIYESCLVEMPQTGRRGSHDPTWGPSTRQRLSVAALRE